MFLDTNRADPAQGLAARLDSLRGGLRRRLELRRAYLRTRRELSRINDRDLADIGLARPDIATMAREAVYGLPARAWPFAPGPETETEMASFTCRAGTRFYQVRLPAERPGGARGLVMLLHGCGQSARSFTESTEIAAQAARQGWIVVSPEQSRRKNVLGCWNWFLPEHRERAGGEAEILASLARETAAAHGVPPGAIFVAGFSAGAAMALALADAYPELFAAVCTHSGVHYAGVRDGASAAAAMRGAFAAEPPLAPRRKVPTLVIQGTADQTVHPSNARRIAAGRGRRARLVLVKGGGHEWTAGAAAEALRFFRAHASSPAARTGARLGGLVGHLLRLRTRAVAGT
ncbi:MAG: alpha/beta hydrolase-fold protein [Paracoccaceae bacterium]|nr:alpha/beta hydrolase-fold protein [Paracoccaceae bacterium]